MVRRRAGQADEDAAAAVRGPSSALTSFLRGQGIISRPRAIEEARQERQQQSDRASQEPVASGSSPRTPVEQETPAVASPEAGPSKVSGKKRKKGKKDADEAEDFELDFSAEHKARYENRKPGSITLCAECGKKFTVTKYTISFGPGLLCMPCEKEMGQDGLTGAATKPSVKKRKTAKPKAAPTEKVKPQMPTLQESCIKIIGQCIEDLEEDTLGDVGPGNLEKICKIVCKNRALTPQTLKLFLDSSQEDLKLYDCSRIDERGYTTLCNLAPNLRSLTLRYCGTIDDACMDIIQTKLVHLRRLELYGPFLVRADKWKAYFDSLVGRDFVAFRLQQCPRFDMPALQRLIENVPGLVDLQLADLVKLDDAGLKHIETLSQLRHLDVGRAGRDGKSLSDDGVISLLSAIGDKLETLVLDLNEALTDRTLIEGIMPNCRSLEHLSLLNLPKILSSGVESLFKGWNQNPPLHTLNINRITDTDDEALTAILAHSGPSLRLLDLNSCDNITEVGLNTLATTAPQMERLDISFVRASDDFVVKALLEGMPALKVLSVFGNNRVTDTCPRKDGVSIRGQEGQFEAVNWAG